MYEYKTEILTTGFKWFSDKANEADIEQFNERFEERCAEGWELVTYSYMATPMQVKGALLVTYRKKK